jgi:hypothetical protein
LQRMEFFYSPHGVESVLDMNRDTDESQFRLDVSRGEILLSRRLQFDDDVMAVCRSISLVKVLRIRPMILTMAPRWAPAVGV